MHARSALGLALALFGCAQAPPSSTDAGTAPDAAPIDAGASDAGVRAAAWLAAAGMPEGRGRWGAPMTLVPERRAFFMFGGNHYPNGRSSDEAWIFHLDAREWEYVPPAGSPPAPRYCHCATYLPGRDEILLVGGRDDRGPRRPEAFIFDLAQRRWRAIGGPLPRGVIGCTAHWMPKLAKAVVFGGGGATGFDRQTWLYDPTQEVFEAATTTTAPPGRTDPAAIYDPVRERVLLFGGAELAIPPYAHKNDLWAFDGAAWTQLPSLGGPSPRRFPGSAYDAEEDRWIVFGGTREVEDFADLWALELATDTWRPIDVPHAPPPRGFAASGWWQGLVLFGGLRQDFTAALADGWRLAR